MTQWVNNYRGNSASDNRIQNSKGLAAATDKNNNCFVTGYTINPGRGSDIILIKYNEAGDTLYSRTYTGTGDGEDRAFGIAVDVKEIKDKFLCNRPEQNISTKDKKKKYKYAV